MRGTLTVSGKGETAGKQQYAEQNILPFAGEHFF
jgi:hypothetical protein